jgi:uncharacterized protein with GYD domain
MAILITTARFTADGAQGGVVVAPSEHVEAAARLIAGIGGTLIGCYRTSGDHDVLLIFEAPSYEEAVPALDAAAAGSGVTDLKTVRVLASHETKAPLPESRTGAAIRPSEGMSAAQRAAAGRAAAGTPGCGTAPKRRRTPRRRRILSAEKIGRHRGRTPSAVLPRHADDAGSVAAQPRPCEQGRRLLRKAVMPGRCRVPARAVSPARPLPTPDKFRGHAHGQ